MECINQRAAHLGLAGSRASADGAASVLLKRPRSCGTRLGACATRPAGAHGGVQVQHLLRRGTPARVPRHLRRSNGFGCVKRRA